MNVAIFDVNQFSQVIADVINNFYNSWLTQRLGEKVQVTAFVTGGGSTSRNRFCW